MFGNHFGFIGFGLIGGSIARALKEYRKDVVITAYQRGSVPSRSLSLAKEDGVLDVITTNLADFSACDMIFLCAPVQKNIEYLEQLKDIISPNESRQITPEYILEIVAEHFSVTVSDLKSKKKYSEIAIPRQIAMYLCRIMTDTPLKSIGIILGGRDHSTVNHGINKIAEEIKMDEALENTVDIIKKKINPV